MFNFQGKLYIPNDKGRLISIEEVVIPCGVSMLRHKASRACTYIPAHEHPDL